MAQPSPNCWMMSLPVTLPSNRILYDSKGNLRRYFNIFVNGTHIRDLNGLETELKEDDKVILMASAAGG
jgi:molybdopterin converting factor small subunit